VWRGRTLRPQLPSKAKTTSQPHRLQSLWRTIPTRQSSRSGPSSNRPGTDRQYDLQRENAIRGVTQGRRRPGFSIGLIRSALIRKNSDDNVFMLARKSMTVRCYIHSIAKRAEITALVDSGATENFLNLTYARWLKLPIKTLAKPRKLFTALFINMRNREKKNICVPYYKSRPHPR
jgi:hypothetical protein